MAQDRLPSIPTPPASDPLPAGFGRFTALQDDHRALGALLGKLRRTCAVLQESEARAAFAEEASRLLTQLAAELEHHFAREERDEYFGVVVSERPALIPRVAELRAEHTAFLERVTALTQALRRGGDVFEISKQILNWISELDAHERRETQLLGEFFEEE